MEDILASIRRILSEDEQPAAAAANPNAAKPGTAKPGTAKPGTAKPEEAGEAPVEPPSASDVLALDESMLVAEPSAAYDKAADPPPAPPPGSADDDMAALIASMSAQAEPLESETEAEPAPPMPLDLPPPLAQGEGLVAPEAAAATTSAVSSLLRTLEAGRGQGATLPIYRGGPTLEDMVRDEIRPLLKAWLDTNLPPLVERLVRTEIERLVGRAVA